MRPESDVELGSEMGSEERVEKDHVRIEKDNGAEEKEKKRGKDRKENVKLFFFIQNVSEFQFSA